MLPKVKRNIKRISTAERSMRARKMNVMSAMFSGMNIKIISCIGIQQPGAPAGGHLGKPGWGCPCPPGRDIKTRPIIISSPSSCIRPEWLPLLILPPAWSIPPRIGCLRSRDFPARLWLAGRRHVTEPQAPVQCSLVLVSVSPLAWDLKNGIFSWKFIGESKGGIWSATNFFWLPTLHQSSILEIFNLEFNGQFWAHIKASEMFRPQSR